MKLRIFTDGACSGNPGPGGWGALIALHDGNEVLKGNDPDTTNNRMEIMPILHALKYIKDNARKLQREGYDVIEIHSDSAYVVNAVSKGWLKVWQRNGWITTSKEKVKNEDLWRQLLKLLDGIDVTFVKVKGHAGEPLNEMVDGIARSESIKAKRGQVNAQIC